MGYFVMGYFFMGYFVLSPFIDSFCWLCFLFKFNFFFFFQMNLKQFHYRTEKVLMSRKISCFKSGFQISRFSSGIKNFTRKVIDFKQRNFFFSNFYWNEVCVSFMMKGTCKGTSFEVIYFFLEIRKFFLCF